MTTRGRQNPFDPDVFRRFAREGLDTVQIKRAVVGWPGETGDPWRLNSDAGDVEVHVTAADGMQLIARLFAASGLWAVPPRGDEVHVLAQEGDWHTAGAPICLWRHQRTPAHFTGQNAVLEVPAGGLLIGDGATAAAARQGDSVNAGTVTAVAGPYPVQFIYAPADGVPGGSSPSMALTGGKITAGSAKTKVE